MFSYYIEQNIVIYTGFIIIMRYSFYCDHVERLYMSILYIKDTNENGPNWAILLKAFGKF